MSDANDATPSLLDELANIVERVRAGEFVGVAVVAFGADLNIHLSVLGEAANDPLTALGAIEVIRSRIIAAIEESDEITTTH